MRKGSAHAVKFINALTHTKGAFAGQPFRLRPWQRKIVEALFKTAAGRRVIRTCLLMLPRKNGKSEIAAAIALYMLLADGEVGAEVYSAAADRDQAALVFGVAAQMIRNNKTLDARCEILDSQKRIVHHPSGSVYRAISAEAYSKHGFNPSAVIYDELHAAPDRRLWDVLATAQGARSDPLLFAISTAGFDRHSILWELYSHAKKVAENPALDPTFLPIIYEAPTDADWLDEAVWRAANPALGDFRSLDEMRIMAARAREIPAQENSFRRLYLNQWTESETRWLSMEAWDACRGEAEMPAGANCLAGLDLASTQDVAAAVLLFERPDGKLVVLPRFWVPAERIAQRSLRDRVPYDLWARQGLLTATEGNVIEYARIRADLAALAKRYHIREIGFDPWNAEGIRQQLEADGLRTVKVPQTVAFLNEPTKRLGDLVAQHRLVHDGHPVLRWMAGNLVVTTDANGNIRPDKAKSGEKIDGMVALILALAVHLRPQAPAEPAYQMFIYGTGR